MKEYAATLSIVFVFSLLLFSGFNRINDEISSVKASLSVKEQPVVILDAGHGGEDGGAVAFDGTIEKDLNLSFTRKIALFFEVFGIDYYCIRTTDISVGDTTLDTIRQRKVSDIKKRESIINSYSNPIFLSIHMNNFSIEKYNGTQVFFGNKNEKSAILADFIQKTVKSQLQPENNRKIKEATDDIYLLYNSEAPAVMVECGFLSNIEELNKLKNDEYQLKLTYCIADAVLTYLNQRN